MRGRFAAGALVLATVTIAPAEARTNVGRQVWTAVEVTAPIADDVFLTAQIQPRFTSDNAATAPITFIPPVVSWRKSDSLVLSTGYLYAYIDGKQLARGFAEHRFFQQASYRITTIGRVGIRAQTRIEERQRTLGDDWNLRVAQTLLVATPLTKKESGGPVGVISTELYWNMTEADWGARKGYDDLWSFIGVQMPLSESSAVEFGYLNQRQRAVNGVANMNHAAVLNFSFQLLGKIRPPEIVPTVGLGIQPIGRRNPTVVKEGKKPKPRTEPDGTGIKRD